MLGTNSTIAKAISVCEIIKRRFDPESSDDISELITQLTRIYRRDPKENGDDKKPQT